eukprot:COSAG01_NODE_43204_length_432_cov_0.909910_2_plen_52_part_01
MAPAPVAFTVMSAAPLRDPEPGWHAIEAQRPVLSPGLEQPQHTKPFFALPSG